MHKLINVIVFCMWNCFFLFFLSHQTCLNTKPISLYQTIFVEHWIKASNIIWVQHLDVDICNRSFTLQICQKKMSDEFGKLRESPFIGDINNTRICTQFKAIGLNSLAHTSILIKKHHISMRYIANCATHSHPAVRWYELFAITFNHSSQLNAIFLCAEVFAQYAPEWMQYYFAFDLDFL